MIQGEKVKPSNDKLKVYTVQGDPVALARARVTRAQSTNVARVWDSQKQIKLVYGIQIQNQHEDLPLFTGPLHFSVVFYMPIAPTSRKKNMAGSYHYFKPDLDNCLKFILDVCTGILYHEDCIVSSVSAKKMYDENARTEFWITELNRYK